MGTPEDVAAEKYFTPPIEQTAVIKVSPEQDPAVLILAEESRKLRDYAVARIIAADADLKPATEDLSIIARVKKALTEKKVEYLKPIKAHIDSVNAAFASIMVPLDEADAITRKKYNEYRAAQEKRRQEAEEINRQKQELAQREAAFSGTGEITIDTTPVVAPEVIRRVNTDLGSVNTMKIKKWEVEDLSKVPIDYLMIDAAKVGKVVRAGIPGIPGIRIWEEESIRVSTR